MYYFFLNKPQVNQYSEKVLLYKDLISKELEEVDEGIGKVTSFIKSKNVLTFSTAQKLSPHPFFIYKNKNLAFWSDYKFVPNYDILKGNYKYKFVALKNGKYVVRRDSVSNDDNIYEVFSLLPINFHYPIENSYIQSKLNPLIFGNDKSIEITNELEATEKGVYAPEGTYLFSISIAQDENLKNQSALFCIIIFSILAIFCFLLFICQKAIYKPKQFGEGFLVLVFGILIIRSLMLFADFPFSLLELDLFNPKYFASSSLSPSLGDLLLNTISLTVIALYFFKNYYRTVFIKKFLKSSIKTKTIISGIIIVAFHYTLFNVFNIFKTIYFNSQWSPDITMNIDFDFFRVICLFIFILSSLNFFILSHIVLNLFASVSFSSLLYKVLLFAGVTAVYGFLSFVFKFGHWPILFLSTFYFIIIWWLRMPKFLGTVKYGTYVYLLTCSAICAATGAFAIYQLNYEKSLINKYKFASQLLWENDVLGEYLLNEAQNRIESDAFIRTKMTSLFSSLELVDQKIKKFYLSNYFDKYDVGITIFDAEGNVLDNNSEFSSFHHAVKEFKKGRFKTEYKNVFFLNDVDKRGLNRYAVFNEIKLGNRNVGTILILLKNKKIVPNNVYPSLLVDKKFFQPENYKNYHYAIYAGNELLSSFGTFNYEKDFPKRLLENKKLFEEGLLTSNFHHFASKGMDDKIIIVSTEGYSFKRLFSNFSFLFTIFILFVLIFLSIIALYFKLRKLSTNYSTKIQVYLNIAFFLPLFIVSITTLSIISSSYKENLNKAFIKKAENVSANLAVPLEIYIRNASKGEKIESALQQMARYTDADINLFNSKGRLIFTSQPMIFENGLLSKLINPQAFASLLEQRSNTVMLQETVGKLKYNAVYVAVKSFETGNVLGVVSLPFFESKQEIDKQMTEVLTTIINIFISIFVVFLVLSYFATKLLTIPLKIITYKLKKTTLGGENEPIKWEGNDEIGLLVTEYNEMLVKLEQSKKAITQSEKESAWREMAQQVAHEIKNPLTPMKLTIQHLQMNFKQGIPDINQRIEKALNSLLNHINNLSDIATSFSMFAKLPTPKSERFEVCHVLNNVVNIYNSNSEAFLETEIQKGKFFVIGDAQLMSGIFTNLIINGIQSVPNERQARIKVKLSSEGSDLLIAIEDNGTGVPENIKDKIFLPNFSTKYAGSGIGLAVAKKGVEHAKGKIWFECKEGEGTVFFIKLPLVQEE